MSNPKPFFGFSDNTHFQNFLWLNGIHSYYGGALFTQFARQGKMDEYTIDYLKKAFFEEGEFEIKASDIYNDIGLALGTVDGDPGCTPMRHLVSRNMPYNPWLKQGCAKACSYLALRRDFI